ncbi:MAG: DUF4191 domain-containing protein [Actinomycetes bacterium]
MARAEKSAARAEKRKARREQRARLRMAFTTTRKHDRLFLPLLAGSVVVVAGALIAVGFLIGHWLSFTILGVIAGVLAGMVVFGRRATRAAYSEIEGRTGAAASVLNGLRGAWRVRLGVAFTRNQDLVHLAVGRPGIVLVGEGSPHRVQQLLIQEKRRYARAAPDIPVYDVSVGDAPNQVPLRRLQSHITKLPRNIKPARVRELDNRLRALVGGPPIPKGPVPTTGRIPKGARRGLRG